MTVSLKSKKGVIQVKGWRSFRDFAVRNLVIFFLTIIYSSMVINADNNSTAVSSQQTNVHNQPQPKIRYYYGMNEPVISQSPRNTYILHLHTAVKNGVEWAVTIIEQQKRNKELIKINSVCVDQYGREEEGGIDKFLLEFDGLRQRYRSGIACSPYQEKKHYYMSRNVYFYVHPTGEMLLKVLSDWTSKQGLKNISVFTDGSALSPIDSTMVFKVFKKAKVNVYTYIEFNNLSSVDKTAIEYEGFTNILNDESVSASRALFLVGKPDFIAYAISKAYEGGRVNSEHVWMSTGLPEINVAFDLLKHKNVVENAFKSLFFIQSSMVDDFDLGNGLDSRLMNDLNDNLKSYSGFARTMYKAGVACVVLSHMTNRIDHFSSKSNDDQSRSVNYLSKNEGKNPDIEGPFKKYKNGTPHPVTLYKIKEVVECDDNSKSIGFKTDTNVGSKREVTYCFKYEPIVSYKVNNENTYDIEYHNDPTYYDGTKLPPRDIRYETVHQTITSKILISILIAIVLIVALFSSFLTWKRRDDPQVKSSCPPLLSLVLIGVISALVTSALSLFDTNIKLCKSQLFFEHLFYFAVLIPLAVKNWRLYLIFYNPHFSGLSNRKALALCGVLILLPLILLTTMLFIGEDRLDYITFEVNNGYYNYLELCPSVLNVLTIYAVVVIYIYLGIVFLFNLFVLYVCRKLAHRFNESVKIALCCHSILILIVIKYFLINGIGSRERRESTPIVFILNALIVLMTVFGGIVIFSYAPLKRLIQGKTPKGLELNAGGAKLFGNNVAAKAIRIYNNNNEVTEVNLGKMAADDIKSFCCMLKIESSITSLLNKEMICQIIWISSYSLIILIRFQLKGLFSFNKKEVTLNRTVFHVSECIIQLAGGSNDKSVILTLPKKRLILEFESNAELDDFIELLGSAL